ncbi:MAG: primase [Gaiellales bacterium]|jgi:DNA primase|nr:primase [Gaiellales bacterium]
MSRIAARSIEAVKERADIVELARARTELRQARDEWVGRCPFHEERSPSFSVNAGKKLYYCFGCGAKGDVIDFVRQTEAVDYVGAIEWLAGRYGLELEYEEASPAEEARRRRDDRLRTLLDETARWYARRLTTGAAGAAARAYLTGRGLSDEVIERYGVGLAPDAWDGLSRAAQGRGYTADELVTAGLALRAARTGNVIDHFRGRLMFPIADARGRVVAFGGRVLPGSDDKRKYVNSPEGPLFHKGDVLYGLHLARTEIARRDLALVVEGYTDALALAQAGHPNVVASQGTALTERQLRLLRGLSRNVVLLFDADAAGAEAALRGVQIAEREGLSVRVAVLPPGLDPADAAIEQPDALAAAVSGAPSVLTYRVHSQLAAGDLSSAGGRDAAFAVLRETLAEAPASIERSELVQLISGRLRLPSDLTAELAPRRAQRRPARDGVPAARRVRLDPAALDEQRLLALAVVDDAAQAAVERLGADSFGLAEHAAVARALIARSAGLAPDALDAAALAELEPELAARGAREARDAAAIADATRRVEARAIENQMEPLKRKLEEDDITREELQELLRLQALARALHRTS